MSRKEMLRIVSFKLDVNTLLELDKLAIKERRHRSELIREAIKMYISNTSKSNLHVS